MTKRPVYKMWWFWAIIIIIIVIIVIVIANSQKLSQQKSNQENIETVVEEQTTNNKEIQSRNAKGGFIASQDAVEEKCQDAGLLGKYVNLDEISIVYMTNYNDYFENLEGEYDKDGNTIAFFHWNGKDNTTDEPITFNCYVSGPNDENLTIHYLGADTTDFIGSADFETYNEDGNLIK